MLREVFLSGGTENGSSVSHEMLITAKNWTIQQGNLLEVRKELRPSQVHLSDASYTARAAEEGLHPYKYSSVKVYIYFSFVLLSDLITQQQLSKSKYM